MLIQHSPQILLHRIATIEAQSLEARGALVAKHRGEAMIRQAIERLDAPAETAAPEGGKLDRRA